MAKKLLISICLFVFTFPIFAQDIGTNMLEEGQPNMIAKVEKDNPALAKFQSRLLEITVEINATVQDYGKGRISREKAKEILRPLLKEQTGILNNPDFLVEQQIFALLSQR